MSPKILNYETVHVALKGCSNVKSADAYNSDMKDKKANMIAKISLSKYALKSNIVCNKQNQTKLI